MSKWVKFDDLGAKPGQKTTRVIAVAVKSGDILGVIKWFPQWRQYTFMPQTQTVFNKECLEDIANAVDWLNAGHKAKRRATE